MKLQEEERKRKEKEEMYAKRCADEKRLFEEAKENRANQKKEENDELEKLFMLASDELENDCIDLPKDGLEDSNNVLYLKTCEVDSKENQLNNQDLNSNVNQSN